ncbi:DUF1648 domain-containing protein [Corynebacterium variabile]|uniref:DUF1648 domain-containing protein n=1 Tax=Corynebacterium variabile TaxID=1727 RepID=UPI0028A1787F|nr:DUF1648 domain-containing protein [Corynebacterium variabile]
MASGAAEKVKNGSGRPARTYAAGPVTVWLRRLVLVATAAVTVWVLVRYPGMPDTVPVHFGTGGDADDWGSKSTILWLSLIMLACIGGCHWLSSRPRIFNYPKELTEGNAQAMYRGGEQMMVWLNAGLVVCYLGIAAGMLTDINILVILLPGLVLLLGGTVVGIVKMVRA